MEVLSLRNLGLGIFTNKNDQNSQLSAASGPVTSIDGFLGTGIGNDQSMQNSIDDIIGQDDLPTITPEPSAPTDYILTDDPAPQITAVPPPAPTANVASVPVQDTDIQDLSAIKQQALQQLTPIVNQLDQSPEERFHTTMMLVQATDDQSLVRVAYEAAQNITDEKTRAQALLDIVNEINYFTAQNKPA
ncbi:MAG: hypothetical protein M3Q36_03135 [bacterium]|nr:hypothetical protein [bacterium]